MTGPRNAGSDVTRAAAEPEEGIRRRQAAGLVASIASIGAAPIASAKIEGVRENPDEYVPVEPGNVPARLQSILVGVGDKEALEKEIKFWTEACKMKVLGDYADASDKRNVILGFPGTGGEGPPFGIKVQVDPEVAKRPLPRFLNYDVMQPTVDAFNFVQIAAQGKVKEMFAAVQGSGGMSLIGDLTYLDAESPRGVPVRMVKRDSAPCVETVSLNIEVPAYETLTKLYQRGFGYEELKYPEDDPPVQPFSVYLRSKIGGPKLLLSPVPDGRMKERPLDELEGVLMVASDGKALSSQADAAVQLAVEEQRQKDEEEVKRRQEAIAAGREPPPKNTETKAYPKFNSVTPTVSDSGIVVDDGLGDMIYIGSASDFASRLSA